MVYLIALKLEASEDTYYDLINYLKGFGYWARPMPNIWFIKSYLFASIIRDSIMSKIGPSDKVLVIEVSQNWGSFRIEKNVTDWMKNNL